MWAHEHAEVDVGPGRRSSRLHSSCATSRAAVGRRRARHARRAPRQGRDGRLGHRDERRRSSPAAVGVDIGCGMAAVRTSLRLEDLPDDLHPLRTRHRAAVPGGFAGHHGTRSTPLSLVCRNARAEGWGRFWLGFDDARRAGRRTRPRRRRSSWARSAAATTSSRCALRRRRRVWVMLHSGSRGIGNLLAQGTWRRPGIAAQRGICPTVTSRSSSTARPRWRPTGAI
jgi:hypothetical protein